MSDENNNKYILKKIFQYIFESLFIAFVIFFLAEYFKTGIITNYFHYNILLTLTLFSGIIVIIWGANGQKENRHVILNRITHIFVAFLLAVIAVLAVSQKFSASGAFENNFFLYAVIPWAVGMGIFFTVWVILKEKN